MELPEEALFLSASPRLRYFKEPESGPGIHDYYSANPDQANLVSSLLPNGRHAPILDLDKPHHCVQSSTPGHSHLYLDTEMPWWKLRLLLWVLRFTGVIGPGFYKMSVKRRMTMVRQPGVLKQGVPKGAQSTANTRCTASWGTSDY